MSADGVRSDLVTLLATVLGRDVAEAKVSSVEQLVRSRAAAGTAAGVDAKLPAIRASVDAELRRKIAPLFIGAMITAGVATAVGVAAIVSRRSS